MTFVIIWSRILIIKLPNNQRVSTRKKKQRPIKPASSTKYLFRLTTVRQSIMGKYRNDLWSYALARAKRIGEKIIIILHRESVRKTDDMVITIIITCRYEVIFLFHNFTFVSDIGLIELYVQIMKCHLENANRYIADNVHTTLRIRCLPPFL